MVVRGNATFARGDPVPTGSASPAPGRRSRRTRTATCSSSAATWPRRGPRSWSGRASRPTRSSAARSPTARPSTSTAARSTMAYPPPSRPYDEPLAGLAAKSDAYAAKPVTGTVDVTDTAVTLTGDGASDPQVFTVDGAGLVPRTGRPAGPSRSSACPTGPGRRQPHRTVGGPRHRHPARPGRRDRRPVGRPVLRRPRHAPAVERPRCLDRRRRRPGPAAGQPAGRHRLEHDHPPRRRHQRPGPRRRRPRAHRLGRAAQLPVPAGPRPDVWPGPEAPRCADPGRRAAGPRRHRGPGPLLRGHLRVPPRRGGRDPGRRHLAAAGPGRRPGPLRGRPRRGGVLRRGTARGAAGAGLGLGAAGDRTGQGQGRQARPAWASP